MAATGSPATFVGSYKDGDWQASNLTQRIIDRGLTRIDHFDKIYDVDGGIGGPIPQNRLWFFTSHRRLGNDTPVFNSFYPDGSPGIQDDRTWADQLRLTYQVNQKNRLVGFWNYTGKAVGHQLTPGTEPRASVGWYAPNYLAAYAKWTATLTNRLLLEVGPIGRQPAPQVSDAGRRSAGRVHARAGMRMHLTRISTGDAHGRAAEHHL